MVISQANWYYSQYVKHTGEIKAKGKWAVELIAIVI